MFIGLGLGITRLGGGGAPAVPVAPVLTLLSAADENPAQIRITPVDWQASDAFPIRVSALADFSDVPDVDAETLEPGGVTGTYIDTSVDLPSDGTWYINVGVLRGTTLVWSDDVLTVTIVPAVTATTFNTTPFSGTATFSNGDRTVVITNDGGSIGTAAAITGKKVFVFTLDIYPSDHAAFGLGTADLGDKAGYGGGKSAIYLAFGQIVGPAGTFDPLPLISVGDSIALVVDEANSKAWWTKDGTAFYGNSTTVRSKPDVEAGTGGYDISSIIAHGAIYGIVGNLFGTTGHGFTISTSYPWAMPSGYSLL